MTCGSQRDKFTWFVYAMAMVQEAALAQPSRKSRRQSLPRGMALPVVSPLRPDLRNH
jgi:hypothetical protein